MLGGFEPLLLRLRTCDTAIALLISGQMRNCKKIKGIFSRSLLVMLRVQTVIFDSLWHLAPYNATMTTYRLASQRAASWLQRSNDRKGRPKQGSAPARGCVSEQSSRILCNVGAVVGLIGFNANGVAITILRLRMKESKPCLKAIPWPSDLSSCSPSTPAVLVAANR